ncbi:MAG: aldehyde dehydrogenase family protein [Actinobacteria bacterium]|nr:aldehyde dehydrogenase family protein [Actinomycetota bacterium]
MVAHDRFFIDGDWRIADDPGRTIDVIESRNGRPMATVAAANHADVAAAVEAAARAFPAWVGTPVAERAAILARLGDALARRAEELAALEAREIGTPLTANRRFHVDATADYFRRLGAYADAVEWEMRLPESRSIRVPLGPVGLITPWNNPLLITAMKAGSALVAGSTAVMKISELAPLGLFHLADAANEAGLPPGALNVLSGHGAEAGEALVAHPAIAAVSFTGSIAAARRVASLAGERIKPVTLELGGKSASILLDDADFHPAIERSVESAFHHNGQYCLATTRVLVPRSRLAEAEELAAAVVEEWQPGDPLDGSTRLGPVVSARHRDRVVAYIEAGIAEGARLVVGGSDRPAGFEQGFYVRPTVFSEVDNGMVVAREELFGPIQVLIPYPDGDDDAAIAIANDSEYGLGGAVWSADQARAERVAGAMHTGSIEINGAMLGLDAPCGGFKNSGFGRESGRVGVEDFLTWKALHGAVHA